MHRGTKVRTQALNEGGALGNTVTVVPVNKLFQH